MGEIIFKGHDPNHFPDHIEALRKELFSLGHNVQVQYDREAPEDAPVKILIAPKLL